MFPPFELISATLSAIDPPAESSVFELSKMSPPCDSIVTPWADVAILSAASKEILSLVELTRLAPKVISPPYIVIGPAIESAELIVTSAVFPSLPILKLLSVVGKDHVLLSNEELKLFEDGSIIKPPVPEKVFTDEFGALFLRIKTPSEIEFVPE